MFVIDEEIDEENDVKYKDDYPLHSACLEKSVSLEKILNLVENQNYDVNLLDNYDNNSPLHMALLNPNMKLNIVEYLVEKKSNINQKNNKKRIPLLYSIINVIEIEDYPVEIVK